MSRPALLHRLSALARDRRGATVVEFALIAPALLMILLGLMDLSYNLYTSTVLEGAIQKAARDATLEGAEARGLAIDNRVRAVVGDIVPGGTVAFDRRAYIDFSDINRPEDFTDVNADGLCNEGEPFEDVNGNGLWDEDRAKADMGGARDAVLYTVRVSYPRAFPVMGLLGFDPDVTAQARTVLRNQPYGTQDRTVTMGSCE
ncbi:MAG TPA: TadE/TadG family type IV pilus assembly protein [Croceibacterium sp.]|nr:TadE/TadG family type IV pilus assembly protein [Croceibacterium sp.]